ncbi:MAG: GTPase Era [Bacteroidetes bacterium]|nr:GTPase Era [Bacteroidota bacterium]
MDKQFKSGLVNIIGLPNAGKSTLLNAIIGQKISAVTHKAQTTRHRIKAIFNEEQSQIIFYDTPGLIKPAYLLQEKMMDFVREALKDTDLNLLIVDASSTKEDYQLIDAFISLSSKPLIIALNKSDKIESDVLDKQYDNWKAKYPKAGIIAVSAKNGTNLHALLEVIKVALPIHPPYYDTDELTDRSTRFFIQELIREQILLMFHEEIPYAVHIIVDEFKEKETITVIKATVFVERETQKGILLGHKGSSIRELGIRCRKQIEDFVQQKVFLELSIKVRKDWRNSEQELNRWGYKQ